MAIGAAITQSSPVAALPSPVANTCRVHAPEAAMRSGIDVGVLLRVMRAESGGDANAVSLKGAIGCMQIMPATWRALSNRYGFGADPYDARMNMIGGALYLAELARRYGWPGAYAAYSAGPARYIRYAIGGVPLPAETVAYVSRLGGAAAPSVANSPHARWQEARLFLIREEPRTPGERQSRQLASTRDGESGSPDGRSSPTLFPLSANAATAVR